MEGMLSDGFTTSQNALGSRKRLSGLSNPLVPEPDAVHICTLALALPSQDFSGQAPTAFSMP